ncbi:uncharacterized protein K02A2.6-like [Drosophila rhopaloa]|uniref:RNA-directed DNA polymerase n=1 Tax=Drosophila rhopaloa TaxID=1041015 RepID=A0ABM5J3A2_DRORH|nr:uncharacterized protein K02A2.6-like [Drosophila rhopaloa]
MLVMPTMLDRVILGMDFLKAAGTRVRCGQATLELRSEPQARGDPLLQPVLIPPRDDRERAVHSDKFRVQLGTARQGGTEVLSPTPTWNAATTKDTGKTARTEAEDHDKGRRIAPLSPRQQGFLEQELALFESLQGVSQIAEHRIVMSDDKPLKQRYYPRNPAMQHVIDTQVDELLRAGAIEPSRSPHSAPIVLVKKKGGLNAHSVPDAYPVPRINHILEKLRHARYISTLDLKNGYWQIPMAKDSRQYTAFTVPGRGLYQWKVMPFGLHSASATFQRALDSVIGAEMEPVAFAYLDDIIVVSATEEQHLAHLAEVFRRLRAANLRINPRKCTFFKQKLVYLGHVISGEGIQTDPEKVSAINGLKIPTNLKELRQWIGMASWYRRFVPGFATIVQPVTALLKKGRKWTWGPEQQTALDEIRRCLTTAPVLGCPDFDRKFVLQTDASDIGLGAVLSQDVEGQEKPCEVLQGAIELKDHCEWIRKMKDKVRDEPEKFSDYMMENGQLYRNMGYRADDEDYFPWKLCVPTSCRARVLYECHDSPTAGHLGVRKTITRLSQRYFWPGMYRDAKQHVRHCESCQKFKTVQTKAAGKMLTRVVSEPFDILCADFVGPLPRSKQGNSMLLVFHDVFSKWVELIPLRKATAAAVQKAFRERILGRVGTPRKFVCDNGTQFTSRALKDYFAKLGVEVQYTAPYCPQENPTERTNRTVKTLISQLSEGDQSTWDNMLPEISLAINSSVSDSTGYTPAFLTQGRELRLPAMLYDELTPGSAVAHTGPEDKASHLQGIFDIVRSNLQRASLEQARHYNLRRREWRPTLGSQVWLRQHPLSKATEGFAAKLAPKYDGPYTVAKFTSPNLMDDVIMLSDDSQDTEAFYPRANDGDSQSDGRLYIAPREERGGCDEPA